MAAALLVLSAIGRQHAFVRPRLIRNKITVINLQSAADTPSGRFYDNLAFSFCGMSEQRESTIETKRQIARSQEGEKLNTSQLAIKRNPLLV
jgi:hypothetical protein